MALTQITTPATTDPNTTDWQNFIAWLEKVQRGYINLTLTEMDSTTVPQVAAGSVVEVNGSGYYAATAQSISGSATSDSLNYIKMVSGTPTWTDTEPTWSAAKGGWYDSNDRYVGGCYYDGSDYTQKFVYDQDGRIKNNELSGDFYLKNNEPFVLPAAQQGDKIKIVSDGYSKIEQGNAEEVINYQNRYYTTKGTAGHVQLYDKNSCELVYKGSGLAPIEPGTKLSNPSTLPTGTGGYSLDFSFDGIYLAIPHTTSPYITIYKRTGDTFTKLTNPATLPAANAIGCAFSYDSTYLAVGHGSGGAGVYISVYKRSGDTFTKLASPATALGGDGWDCAFSTDGVYLAAAHVGSPYVTIYKRSGDTFTKLTNPATLPAGNAKGCDFSYDGNYLAVVHDNSPYVTIYKRSGDTFTKLTNPSTLPTGQGIGCSFSTDGNYLAVAHTTSPYITIYKRTGDTFTKLTNPATLPAGTGYSCNFSYNGNYLAVAHATSPNLTIYKRTGDTFTKLTNPATLPSANNFACAFSYDGTYLALSLQTSPYINIYKQKESVDKEWIMASINTYLADVQAGQDAALKNRFQ